MRCDLHVHSIRSGRTDLPLLRHVASECHSDPLHVYDVARSRGMDLVTLTDHDTIEGALEIEGLPGTFVSEEVTCTLPSGRELHVGVFDIDERQHERIAKRRRDPEALFAFLAEERIPACANHLFSALTGRRRLEDIRLALDNMELIEARNGMMSEASNACATAAGRRAGLSPVGGSDAHTLASVARAHTVVPGATSREEFLDGLRRGFTVPAGGSGSYARLTADIARVFAGACRHNARHGLEGVSGAARLALIVAAAPLAPLIPLIAAGMYACEHLFALRHYRRFEKSAMRTEKRRAPSGPMGPAAASSPA